MNVLKLVTSTDLDNKTIHINEQQKLEEVGSTDYRTSVITLLAENPFLLTL